MVDCGNGGIRGDRRLWCLPKKDSSKPFALSKSNPWGRSPLLKHSDCCQQYNFQERPTKIQTMHTIVIGIV